MFQKLFCKIGFHSYDKWKPIKIAEFTLSGVLFEPTTVHRNFDAQYRNCKCCGIRQFLVMGHKYHG